VRQALLKDLYSPYKISIIDGVDMVGEEWIYYAGIAVNDKVKEAYEGRDKVIRELAVLAAGNLGERLISKGELHSAGKSNDMSRATRMAQAAILVFGLSPTWGTSSIPSGMNLVDYIQSLSNEQRAKLEKEVNSMIAEAEEMARQTLERNYSQALIPLAMQLAEKGEMTAKDLK